MARKKRDPNRQGRIAQIRATYKMTRKTDPRVGLVTMAWALGVFAVLFLLGVLVDHPVWFGFFAFFSALMTWTLVFGRRAERAAYGQIEGQPGAAVAALQTIKRGWYVTPAVAVTREQDVLHRAVGAPGIVLVGEGSPRRLATLIAQERKRLGRVTPDVTVHDIVIGRDAGQVPLAKLNRTVRKLPRTLRGGQIDDTERRLKAMRQSPVAMPKGPMPKNARMPRGGQMR